MATALGQFNYLEVVKFVDFGLYLDGGDGEEILLPTRYIPEGTEVGDKLRVFLYLDSEERLIATTQEPLVQVGQFAWLEVAWVNEYGAFLNWGLMKDLFVPFREQKIKMQQGNSYLVHCHVDEDSYRIVASAKVERYLSPDFPPYQPEDEVSVLIWQKTDLGFKVIVDNRFAGMLYDNEIFAPLRSGMKRTAYIKQVRPDGKIDLTLQSYGRKASGEFAEQLLHYLREHNGFCPLGDKSPAEDIYETFGVSKKVFKKGIGDLFKRRLILITEDGIRLRK